jgi:hypothetical protein
MKDNFAAFYHLAKGQHSLEEVLRLAGFEEEKVICPVCKQEFKDAINIEAIENLGMCLSCDHIRSDADEAERSYCW